MRSNPVPKKTLLRLLIACVFELCLVGTPAEAHAANSCLWLNEATASGLLGGEVAGKVSQPLPRQQTVCLFTTTNVGVKRALRVTVETSANAPARVAAILQKCRGNVDQLKAVGNEGAVCHGVPPPTTVNAWIVGRVRDQVFTISIISGRRNDPVLTRDILEARLYVAAEQVAGNLF